MAHDEDRATEVGEPALEPADGVEIEVVGRLVEDQDVGAGREGHAQAEAPALAPGERRDGPRELLLGEAEVAREGRHAVLELVAVRDVVAIGHVGEPTQVLLGTGGRGLLRGPQLGAEGHDVAEPGQEGREHVAVGLHLVRLAVVAEGGVAAEHRRAAVGLDLTREVAQERGLARAVGRDERGSIAGGEGERHAFEEGVARIAEAEVGDLEGGHRESPGVSTARRRIAARQWCRPAWRDPPRPSRLARPAAGRPRSAASGRGPRRARVATPGVGAQGHEVALCLVHGDE